MNAVTIEAVTKTYGTHVAVDDLSLAVPRGTVYGFIGPNGSGKTSTLRMIMRILHPDRGTIEVLGERSLAAATDRVGYLPEERGLYKQMKVRDLLYFYGQLKGQRLDRATIDSWLERMGLAAWSERRIQALSKGMAQKVQFIATVISRPELVLLDEPFTGLDPVNGVVLRDAVLDLKKEGTTVIFSTHDMAVAEKMCDFIFMIYKGKKVLDGTLDQIQDKYGTDTVRVRLDSDGARLDRLPGVASVSDFGRWQELRMSPGADSQQLLLNLAQLGAVRHFELARPSLQDIFVRIAGLETKEDLAMSTEALEENHA
jgi:ABC-2 type transport system ATP-binding protein